VFIFQESLRMSESKVLHNTVTVKLVRLTEINLNKPYSKFRNSDFSDEIPIRNDLTQGDSLLFFTISTITVLEKQKERQL